MVARSRQRAISLSTTARDALREIWLWNADRYGPEHADGYLRFLENAIGTLARPEVAGRPVPGRPDLRYLPFRRRAGAHGHVIVFHAAGDQVTVLRLFHTAEDWQSSLSDTPSQ